MRKRNNIALVIISISILVFLLISGCQSAYNREDVDSTSNTESNLEEVPSPPAVDPEALSPTVHMIDPVLVSNTDEYCCFIVGAIFEKSTGDATKDILQISDGLQQSFDDGVSMGFDIGFKSSVSAEVENMDAYLSFFMQFVPVNITSPRDSVIPSMSYYAKDDQGANFEPIHFTHDDKYIDLEYPYGMILFKGYYDSESATITINNRIFTVDLLSLKEQ